MEPNKKRLRKRKLYKMEIDESLENGVFAISLVSEPAIESLFVYMSKEHQMVKLAEVDKEKRILLGPVLIPNKEIPRIDEETGEEYSIMFTPDVVERAAQLFLQNQKNNNATIEHTARQIPDVSIVESWIIVDPEKDKSNFYGMKYPKGSWMAMMKINNDDVWENYGTKEERCIKERCSLFGMTKGELLDAISEIKANPGFMQSLALDLPD
jgi:hypothetical protein